MHTRIATLFIHMLEIRAIGWKLFMDILEIQHKDRHFIYGYDGPQKDS